METGEDVWTTLVFGFALCYTWFGDEIMIAGSRAKILAVDREASVLTIDHILSWNEGDVANYLYEGSGPDVGAIGRQ